MLKNSFFAASSEPADGKGLGPLDSGEFLEYSAPLVDKLLLEKKATSEDSHV